MVSLVPVDLRTGRRASASFSSLSAVYFLSTRTTQFYEFRNPLPHSTFNRGVSLSLTSVQEHGGLGQDEALEQVRWLIECGKVDMVEISGGNAENKTSKLHSTWGLQVTFLDSPRLC